MAVVGLAFWMLVPRALPEHILASWGDLLSRPSKALAEAVDESIGLISAFSGLLLVLIEVAVAGLLIAGAVIAVLRSWSRLQRLWYRILFGRNVEEDRAPGI